MGYLLTLIGVATLIYSAFGLPIFFTERTQKRLEINSLADQAVALSAGEDRIWQIHEQRQFLNDLLPKSDRVLVEGAKGMYLALNGKESVHVYAGTLRSGEEYLGTLDRAILESYVSRKSAQLSR